jgi:integrase
VEAWKVELQGRRLSDSTIRSAFNALKAILDTAVRGVALAHNVATAVTRPKATPKEAPSWHPEEIRRLLEGAQTSRYAALLAFLVNTSASPRRSARAALVRCWPGGWDAARVRGTLARAGGALVVTEPKTTKSRRSVPLSATAERVLREVRTAQTAERQGGLSVAADRLRVHDRGLGSRRTHATSWKALKAAVKRAGLPDIGLHTLRHSAAAVMLVNGGPLKIVSEVLGHASIGITGDIYRHVSPDVSRDALARLPDAPADKRWS